MREQRIHARLGPCRIEEELGLAVLLHDGIVVADHNRSVRLPVRRYAQAKESQINQKSQDCRSGDKEEHGKEDAPDPVPEIERHDARL